MPNSTKAKSLSTNKIYQVLLLLSGEEKKRLVKFVDSPYFNQSQLLKRILSVLLNESDKNGEDGFSKEKVWKKSFGKEKYNDVNFRKGCSDLLKLVEEFISIEKFKSNESDVQTYLYLKSVESNIKPLYSATLKKARIESNSENPFAQSEDLINNFFIEKAYFKMKGFGLRVSEEYNLSDMSLYLDKFYWIEKLKIAYQALSQSKTKEFTYDIWFKNDIRSLFKDFDLKNNPQLALYFFVFMTRQEEENLEYFYSLKGLLNEYGKTLPKEEAVHLFDSALNYCIGRINKGEKDFYQEYLDLTELGLEKDVLLIDGEIQPVRYSNALTTAMRLGKTDWALNFIEKYKQNLPQYTRENTYTYSLARIYFHQKQFDELLTLLLSVDFEDINYSLIGKSMLGMSYYELDEYDTLDSFLDSFKVYLNRQKNIPTARKKSYQNFIRYIRKLTRLIPGDKEQLEKLRTEIASNRKNTRNYEWLMEKLSEL